MQVDAWPLAGFPLARTREYSRESVVSLLRVSLWAGRRARAASAAVLDVGHGLVCVRRLGYCLEGAVAPLNTSRAPVPLYPVSASCSGVCEHMNPRARARADGHMAVRVAGAPRIPLIPAERVRAWRGGDRSAAHTTTCRHGSVQRSVQRATTCSVCATCNMQRPKCSVQHATLHTARHAAAVRRAMCEDRSLVRHT